MLERAMEYLLRFQRQIGEGTAFDRDSSILDGASAVIIPARERNRNLRDHFALISLSVDSLQRDRQVAIRKIEGLMSNLRLTIACGPYDRTQALRDGTIKPEGIDLNYITLQPAEIFWRMLQYQEFHVSEMSLSNYTSLVSDGNAPFIAIPAFPSRVFRHGYFFINTTKGIEKPSDLKGKRGGVPEYSMTAAVYMRGLMQHEFGVAPSDVEWVQGRTDRLGRKLPSDIRLTQAPAGSELGDLLERGEIDFLMTANNPLSFRRGAKMVRRLLPDYATVEKDY